jgi:hypothetical protein
MHTKPLVGSHSIPCSRQAPTGLTATVVAAVLAGVLFAASTASSEAAQPKRGATYKGTTSQGRAVSIRVSRRNNRLLSESGTVLRTQCGRLGKVSLYTAAFDFRVARDGRMSGSYLSLLEADLGRLIFIDGKRRNVFDVGSYQWSARFVSSRRVSGTWRAQSAMFDADSFPTEDRTLDKCDTGVVTWTARRR